MNKGVSDGGGGVEAEALRGQEGELEVAEMEMWRWMGGTRMDGME